MASSAVSTGVLPCLTTCLGPRTELAGLKSMMPPLVSQSKHMRMAARCCLTVGADLALVKRLDVGGDVHRLDAGERQAVPLAPGEEIADGSGVCLPGVGVADGGGQELDEPLACLLPGVGDDGGQDRRRQSLPAR